MSTIKNKETDNDSNSENETPDNLIVKLHGGISNERIVNKDKLQVIEDLIKCPICFSYLNNPYECEICGGLFCEDCIKDWLKTKEKCPMRCAELKIKRADINSRKLLNVIILRCQNYPDCQYSTNYWDLLAHEEKCPFQKIKCPNSLCKFNGKFVDLQKHLMNCQYSKIECGFCKALIIKKDISEHLEKHQQKKTLIKKNCAFCGSDTDLRRCICNKSICLNCLEDNHLSSHINCFQFSTGYIYTTNIYNVSKHPLPQNFECKINFLSVGWIRVGITFEPSIGDVDEDANCPPFDIYCILEDLKQFYSLKNKWKYIFRNKDISLSKGDSMTMQLLNGELRYFINGEDLGNVVKIPLINKGDFYLYVQCRSENSKAKVEYITEIFN